MESYPTVERFSPSQKSSWLSTAAVLSFFSAIRACLVQDSAAYNASRWPWRVLDVKIPGPSNAEYISDSLWLASHANPFFEYCIQKLTLLS